MLGAFKSVTLTVFLGLGVLSGCGAEFRTAYSEPAPATASRDWRVARVNVTVPESLTTTEQNIFVPKADIVWHGDPAGDRKAQVAEVVKAGVEQGFQGLKGRESVVANVTLLRFHALTPKAFNEAPADTGVHSVGFYLTISDARTGNVLVQPTRIEADLPATMARHLSNHPNLAPGPVWKKEIQNHIAATIRSWLGTGPDIRGSFSRLGG